MTQMWLEYEKYSFRFILQPLLIITNTVWGWGEGGGITFCFALNMICEKNIILASICGGLGDFKINLYSAFTSMGGGD